MRQVYGESHPANGVTVKVLTFGDDLVGTCSAAEI